MYYYLVWFESGWVWIVLGLDWVDFVFGFYWRMSNMMSGELNVVFYMVDVCNKCISCCCVVVVGELYVGLVVYLLIVECCLFKGDVLVMVEIVGL